MGRSRTGVIFRSSIAGDCLTKVLFRGAHDHRTPIDGARDRGCGTAIIPRIPRHPVPLSSVSFFPAPRIGRLGRLDSIGARKRVAMEGYIEARRERAAAEREKKILSHLPSWVPREKGACLLSGDAGKTKNLRFVCGCQTPMVHVSVASKDSTSVPWQALVA